MADKLDYIEKFNNVNKLNDIVIIMLHGLGADYNDFLPIVDELDLSYNVKFIFPNAPLRPITINGGYEMRAWYDIRDFSSLDNNIDHEGIYNSIEIIEKLIQKQIDSGIDSTKIILAGFSQGGVMSYTTSLFTRYRLGGIIALSCYLPLAKNFIEKSLHVNLKTPIFASHGLDDEIVPFKAGVIAKEMLQGAGYQINWHEYKAGHQLAFGQITDIANWLNELKK